MSRRKLFAAAMLAGLVVVPLIVIAFLPPRTGLTKANVERITRGMSMREVKLVFGREPDFQPRKFRIILPAPSMADSHQGSGHVWADHNIIVFVTFDERRRVVGYDLASYSEPDGIFGNIRNWFQR